MPACSAHAGVNIAAMEIEAAIENALSKAFMSTSFVYFSAPYLVDSLMAFENRERNL